MTTAVEVAVKVVVALPVAALAGLLVVMAWQTLVLIWRWAGWRR